MMTKKTKAYYTFVALQSVIALLRAWSAATEYSLAREVRSSSFDEERFEYLTDRAQYLEGAIDNLESIKV